MTIYFSASLAGRKKYEQNYRLIVSELQSLGHKVIYEYLFEKTREEVGKQTEQEKLARQRNLLEWKRDTDLIVAEVSNPSFGQGQEIEDAIRLRKPVLALHVLEVQPHILTAGVEDLVFVIPYIPDTLKKILNENLEALSKGEMRRFTMLLPADLTEYLDRLRVTKNITRSEYIRKLIRADMKRKS
jgi:hypothetical protein